MRFLRAAVSEVVGLFVGDWSQAIGILVILGVGYIAIRVLDDFPMTGFLVALALCAHLVYTTMSESRRRAGR